MSYKTVIINEEDACNVTVVVNDRLPQFDEINDLFNIAIGLYQTKIDNVENNVISNSSAYLNLDQTLQLTVLQNLSSKWIETADEMDTIIQPLTSKLIETGIEMDTLQISNTGNWQDVYEYVEKGVVDGGFF